MAYNKSAIMLSAWNMAREEAEDHGGDAAIYLSRSLRFAWMVAKGHVITGTKKQRAYAEDLLIAFNERLSEIEPVAKSRGVTAWLEAAARARDAAVFYYGDASPFISALANACDPKNINKSYFLNSLADSLKVNK